MNREVHVRIWERPEVRVLWATRQEDPFAPSGLSGRYVIRQKTLAGTRGNGRFFKRPRNGCRRHPSPQQIRMGFSTRYVQPTNVKGRQAIMTLARSSRFAGGKAAVYLRYSEGN